MKKPMRKVLRQAGWALMAAGVLGSTYEAHAQVPAGGLPGTPVQAGGPVAVIAPVPLDADHARLEEIKVELGWLANPATFPYQLRAQAQGATLEIHGYVLNDAVREQALRVARETSKLIVVDVPKPYPNLVVNLRSASAEELRSLSVSLLAEAFGEQASHFEIKTTATGQITVSGTILCTKKSSPSAGASIGWPAVTVS